MEQLLEAAPVQVFDAKALTVTAPEMKTAFTISSIHRMAMTDLHKWVPERRAERLVARFHRQGVMRNLSGLTLGGRTGPRRDQTQLTRLPLDTSKRSQHGHGRGHL